MKLYIYDIDTFAIVAISEGETNEECERKAQIYTNEYQTTYTPAFGYIGGLIDAGNIETL